MPRYSHVCQLDVLLISGSPLCGKAFVLQSLTTTCKHHAILRIVRAMGREWWSCGARAYLSGAMPPISAHRQVLSQGMLSRSMPSPNKCPAERARVSRSFFFLLQPRKVHSMPQRQSIYHVHVACVALQPPHHVCWVTVSITNSNQKKIVGERVLLG